MGSRGTDDGRKSTALAPSASALAARLGRPGIQPLVYAPSALRQAGRIGTRPAEILVGARNPCGDHGEARADGGGVGVWAGRLGGIDCAVGVSEHSTRSGHLGERGFMALPPGRPRRIEAQRDIQENR